MSTSHTGTRREERGDCSACSSHTAASSSCSDHNTDRIPAGTCILDNTRRFLLLVMLMMSASHSECKDTHSWLSGRQCSTRSPAELDCSACSKHRCYLDLVSPGQHRQCRSLQQVLGSRSYQPLCCIPWDTLVSSAWLPWFPASCCYLSFQRNPPQADIVLLNLSTSEGGELAVPASRVTLEVVRARDGKPSSWAQLSVESEWSPEQGFDQDFLLELVLRYQFSCRLSLGSGWFH